VAAKSAMVEPPRPIPRHAALSMPTSSITAAASAIWTSTTGGSSPRSESPSPRMSNMISREKDASRFR